VRLPCGHRRNLLSCVGTCALLGAVAGRNRQAPTRHRVVLLLSRRLTRPPDRRRRRAILAPLPAGSFSFPFAELDRELIDAIPVAVYVCDHTARIVGFNRRAAELWGREPARDERFCGSLRMIRTDGSVLPHHECPMADVLRTGEGVRDASVIVERPDGSRVGVNVTIVPLMNAAGHITGAVNTFQELAELQRADEAVRRRERELHDFVESTTERAEEGRRQSEAELAIELAATQRLYEASSQLIREDDVTALFERIIDSAVAIMRSDMASMKVVDEDRDALRVLTWRGFDDEFGRVFALNTSTSSSAARRLGRRVVVPDVETCDFIAGTPALEDHRRAGIRAVQSTPLVGRSGRLLGMISTHWRQPHEPLERDLRLLDLLARQAADLIERTHREAALRESEAQLRRTSQLLGEAVHAREEFMSTAAHELRNPVNALQLQLVALLRATQDGDKAVPREWASDRIAQAVAAVRRLVRLVETLLDISRMTAGRLDLEPEPMDFGQSVHAVVNRFKEQLNGQAIDTRAASITGSGDRLRFEQIVTNLLSNAIKYGDGLPIEVTLDGDEANVRLSVTDHGIGIEPEHQERLFERFERAVTRRQYAGFGLGLWITRQIVDAMGGQIAVESRVGEGSSFRLAVPRQLTKRTAGHEEAQ
jgi:signal transduction histidine kinase/PAS domain-containing protein